jgi:hypothetical protein
MPDISDEEYAKLLNAQRIVGELVSPKTVHEAQKLFKVHHPDFVTDLEKAKPIRDEAVDELKKILDERDKKKRDEELDRKFYTDLDSYRLSEKNPDGFTEEGIEEIKKTMREHQIGDVHVAVAYYQKQHPPKLEPPSGYKSPNWNFAAVDKDDASKKLLFENEDLWADIEARKVYEENRRQPI